MGCTHIFKVIPTHPDIQRCHLQFLCIFLTNFFLTFSNYGHRAGKGDSGYTPVLLFSITQHIECQESLMTFTDNPV